MGFAFAMLVVGGLMLYAGVKGKPLRRLLVGDFGDGDTTKPNANASPPRSVTQGSGEFGTQRGHYDR